MLNKRAKEILAIKAVAGRKLPPDENLSELFLEAMLWVSNKCVPSELLRLNESEDKVYRQLNNGFFICVPDKPNFSDENEHIMIDESLTYAVIDYVAFLINQEIFYKNSALEIIFDYTANDSKGKEYDSKYDTYY